jgi:hypothetical protein
MSRDSYPTINIANAQFIFYTNFKGAAGPYNNEGERNFNVILEGEALEQALAYGMNVKTTKPREGYDPVSYIKVNVAYKYRAPIAQLINSRVKRNLTEQTIGLFDDYEYENVDIVIRPNRWRHPGGASGVNAYLQAIYATVVEDPFVSKYYDIPSVDDDGVVSDS